MKNKGRRHKSGRGPLADGNCKGTLCGITRPINQMGSRGMSKFSKRKWSKRVRGYFKSQTFLTRHMAEYISDFLK